MVAAQVLRLAMCIVGASDTSDVDAITTAAKALWPHWSWLAICKHQDGICILAQNAGKNITVSKAVKDLQGQLPDHLQVIRVFKAPPDDAAAKAEYIAQFGAFSGSGKRKANFVRTYVDEKNIKNYNHPSVLTQREIALKLEQKSAESEIHSVLVSIIEKINKKDHEENVNHMEDTTACPVCSQAFFDRLEDAMYY
jgi:hypothetical protein